MGNDESKEREYFLFIVSRLLLLHLLGCWLDDFKTLFWFLDIIMFDKILTKSLIKAENKPRVNMYFFFCFVDNILTVLLL